MLRCHQCHSTLEDGSQFCANCGAKVRLDTPPSDPNYGNSYRPIPPQQVSPQPTSPQPAHQRPPSPHSSPQNAWQNAPYSAPPAYQAPRKSPLIPIIISVAALLLIITAAVIFFVLRSQNIRLKMLVIEQTATAAQLGRNQAETQEAITETARQTEQSPTEVVAPLPTQAPPTPAPTPVPTEPTPDYAEQAKILALIPEDEQWRLQGATKVEDVLTHQESIYRYDDWLETVWIADSLKNFVLTVTFENPEELRWGEHWDLGILFRHKGGNDQFRIYTTTPDYWELAYVGGSVYNWSVIRGIQGKIAALNLEAGGKNTIVLIADGDSGAYYINGKLIYNLDLRSRPGSGSILAWFDYNAKLRDGEKIFFSDIHLWSLD